MSKGKGLTIFLWIYEQCFDTILIKLIRWDCSVFLHEFSCGKLSYLLNFRVNIELLNNNQNMIGRIVPCLNTGSFRLIKLLGKRVKHQYILESE